MHVQLLLGAPVSVQFRADAISDAAIIPAMIRSLFTAREAAASVPAMSLGSIARNNHDYAQCDDGKYDQKQKATASDAVMNEGQAWAGRCEMESVNECMHKCILTF